ncbi:DUF6030 family protein [uncultured Roseibium sp.]|uniref:DUF6030 family protein n=1 Tax=uncultured Roseibium sp. TaxID=1936171 RepID=UPI003216C9DB
MKRGILKFLQDRLSVRSRSHEVPDRTARRAYSPHYRAERQRLRWGDGAQAATQSKNDRTPGSRPDGTSRPSQPRLPDLRKAIFYGLPLLICLAVIAVLFVTGHKEPPPPPVEKKASLPDPLAGYPEKVKQELLAPEARVPATLKLTFTGDPADLCRELAALGLENSGWRRAPFARDRWQCNSELVALTTPSVDYGSATLFLLMRGPDEETVDYLRLKLNVEDPKQMEIGQEAVRLVIGALSDRYAWAVPDKVLDAIAHFKPLEMTDRGVRLSVAPEDPDLTGDPAARQRLNIIIDFGKPDLIRSAKEFERQPQPRTRRGLIPAAE